ncbi:hypothetical protein PYW07_000520 [Mythimna separata]|uniref:Uncharacterized protein n=1 Tax=Mythimna separata TaxID=271217 RepID=A0AAD7Z3T5_MYTSE|nr:hypothetical protein PYW07_000520 [Mythimna separata]
MYVVHDGDIIYKETYGTANKQRIYVKPPDQTNVVVYEEEKDRKVINFIARVFLPQGYPDSVSRDYTNYQIWDTAQAFCSTITGILATQEVLRGVGVGDNTATPLAATITWVIKDGCGHLGKIYFAYSRGTHLDAYSKKWRLYADTLNDAAMCIEIALPAFKNYTTVILCISTVMKAIVGVAGGATRVAMTQHHAIRSNLADVSAKDAAQETAVNLIASLAALLIITVFGSSLTIFAIMMVFHIIFNYMAVRSVCLRTLNVPRYLQIIDTYLREEIIAKPCLVNRDEPVITWSIRRNYLDRNLCGFQITIGDSMKSLVKKNPKAVSLNRIKEVYNAKDYMIYPCLKTRTIYIFLRHSATSEDILCAYFQSVLLGVIICAINKYDLPIYKSSKVASKPFAQVCEIFQKAEWSRQVREDLCECPTTAFKFNASIEVMEFLNKIVEKEWLKIKPGLEQVGWDLKKNLLIIEEWRITNVKVAKQPARQQDGSGGHTTRNFPSFNLRELSKSNNTIIDEDESKTYMIEVDNKIVTESRHIVTEDRRASTSQEQ